MIIFSSIEGRIEYQLNDEYRDFCSKDANTTLVIIKFQVSINETKY